MTRIVMCINETTDSRVFTSARFAYAMSFISVLHVSVRTKPIRTNLSSSN